MRKVDREKWEGEEIRENGETITEIVASNVVASCPPEWCLTSIPTTCANFKLLSNCSFC